MGTAPLSGVELSAITLGLARDLASHGQADREEPDGSGDDRDRYGHADVVTEHRTRPASGGPADCRTVGDMGDGTPDRPRRRPGATVGAVA